MQIFKNEDAERFSYIFENGIHESVENFVLFISARIKGENHVYKEMAEVVQNFVFLRG